MKTSQWPIIMTLLRIAVVPVIVILMLLQPKSWPLICWFLFVVASITDWLDGYLARKLNSVSEWGKLLDPIADKVLVSSVLILFIPLRQIEAIAVIFLINRDMIIGGIRSMAAAKGQILAAGTLGKWKTTVQMIAIPSLFLGIDYNFLPFQEVGYWGLWLSVVLSLVSGLEYAINFYRSKNAPVS